MQVIKTKTPTHKTTPKLPKPKECPYCKSELTSSEKDFYPCSCTFQACENCFDDILNNKGLCPSCHKPLRHNRPRALHSSKKEELHKSEIEKMNGEKCKKKTTTTIVTTVSSKHGTSTTHTTGHKTEPKIHLPKMSLSELSKLRIIQRNLVYVIGLAPQIAKPEILEKYEYFGQYGKISKIVVNKGNAYNSASASGPSFSAYITFVKELEASIAILAADQFVVNDRTLRTSYGTTKYCTFFLKQQSCPNPDCLYLHSCENKEELLIKDETLSNKEIFMDQQKLTMDFIEKHFDEVLKRSSQETSTVKTVFPSLSSVQAKAKKLIEQRIKERQSQKEVSEKSRRDSIQSSQSSKTDNKENQNTNTERSDFDERTSHHDSESIPSSISPKKKLNKQESKVEGTSENALYSHRSSSSNWSTTDNSLKKDGNLEQKEDVESKASPKFEPERKTVEEVCPNLDSESLRKVSIGSTKPKSSIHDAVEDSEMGPGSLNRLKSLKENDEDGFKDDFDKGIYTKLTELITICKSSRFHCTQEGETEESKQAQAEEQQDFSDISKLITEYVLKPGEVGQDSTENKVAENNENYTQPKKNRFSKMEHEKGQIFGTTNQKDNTNFIQIKEGHNNTYSKASNYKAKSEKILNQNIQKGNFEQKNVQKGINNPQSNLNPRHMNKHSAEFCPANKNWDITNPTKKNMYIKTDNDNKGAAYKLSSFH